MSGLYALYQIIALLTQAFVMLIIIQFVIGLLFAFNVVSPSNQFLMAFYTGINRFLDPLLRPVRRYMVRKKKAKAAPELRKRKKRKKSSPSGWSRFGSTSLATSHWAMASSRA